jgi:hypothetical protein
MNTPEASAPPDSIRLPMLKPTMKPTPSSAGRQVDAEEADRALAEVARDREDSGENRKPTARA